MRVITGLLFIVTSLLWVNIVFANLSDGLVAHYKFDGNTNDSSSNHLDGVLQSATLGNGKFGYGLDLTGNENARMIVNDNDLLDITDNLTVSAWVKRTGHYRSHHPMIVVKNNVNTSYLLWPSADHRSLENSEFAFRVDLQGYDPEVYSGVAPQIGVWYHVVGVRDGDSLKIYVDGLLKAEEHISNAKISTTDGNLTVGDDNINEGRGAFNGNIDEVRIYNRALTTSEIQQLADEDSSFTPTQMTVPVYGNIPKDPECGSLTENIVFITHGWNSNVEAWPNELRDKIKKKISHAQIKGELAQNSPWCVWAYDWNAEAAVSNPTTVIPSIAYVKAANQGRAVAEKLNKLAKLKYIHFIGHSAGSNLIQTAVEKIRDYKHSSIIIHSTFLDAFTSARLGGDRYGTHADWAEHYVDKRVLLVDWPDTTDIDFPDSTNFAIERLDPNPTGSLMDLHGWPYEYYLNSLDFTPDCLGFQLSYESGNYGLTASDWLSAIAGKFSCNNSCNNYEILSSNSCGPFSPTEQSKPSALLVSLVKVLDLAEAAVIISTSGLFTIEGNGIVLETGSPVWVTVELNVDREINALEFNYQFMTDAKGLFAAYFDGKILYFSDEIYDSKDKKNTGYLSLGESVKPGSHTLSFRIDPQNSSTSSVRIGEIKALDISSSEFPWPMFLPAIIGPQQ